MSVCGRYLHVQWSDLWTTKPGVFFLVWIYFTNLMLCQLRLLRGSIERVLCRYAEPALEISCRHHSDASGCPP